MNRTLILAGWGYLDSACASAAILRLHPKADVVPMGGRRLTGYIEAQKDILSHPLGRLFIVGAPPPTEETGLAETLEFLVRSKCQVHWFGWNKVCGNGLHEKGAVAQCPTDRLGSLCATVSSPLELENTEDLTGLVKEDSGHNALQSALLLGSAAFPARRVAPWMCDSLPTRTATCWR